MKLQSINTEQKLYVMAESGGGYSCYGFDVLDRKARAVADWLRSEGKIINKPAHAPGTPEHFRECDTLMDIGARYASATGKRCDAELEPLLIGKEGQRVEVCHNGEKWRFYVGKPTGWMPCHLEIKTKRSSGACVYIPKGATVQVIHQH